MTQPVVLVALGLDEPTDALVALATEQARLQGARLILAHVVPTPTVAFAEARLATLELPGAEPQTPTLVQSARERMTDLVARCAQHGVDTCDAVTVGDPAAAILDLARTHHATMIVLGTHGRRGLSRMLVGSVAEAVLREAEVPVLVSRTPQAP